MIKQIIAELKADIKRSWNWCRIKFLSIFTNRIKKIEIKDQKGDKHEVTLEQKVEKVCIHDKIKMIAPTMWKCQNCDDVYFQINYKVQLTHNDLIKYLDDIATSIKHDFDTTEKK